MSIKLRDYEAQRGRSEAEKSQLLSQIDELSSANSRLKLQLSELNQDNASITKV